MESEHSSWLRSFAPQLFSEEHGVFFLKADRHEATLPCNYCMQPCYATYAMSSHVVQRLHGTRCTPRLHGKVAPCLSALTGASGTKIQLLPHCSQFPEWPFPPKCVVISGHIRCLLIKMETLMCCIRGFQFIIYLKVFIYI